MSTPENKPWYIGPVGKYFIWAKADSPKGRKVLYGIGDLPGHPPLCNCRLLSTLLSQRGL